MLKNLTHNMSRILVVKTSTDDIWEIVTSFLGGSLAELRMVEAWGREGSKIRKKW